MDGCGKRYGVHIKTEQRFPLSHKWRIGVIPYCLVKIRKDKGYTAFNPVSEQNREMYASGYRIMEQCDGVRTVEEIAEVIAADLKMEKTASLTYVSNFLNEMSREGILAWRATCAACTVIIPMPMKNPMGRR
jgi:Coenzyme PQQ synthesis protein D (PqqD)